ncbi:DUF4307 domain-containing protein [Mariniluteicoccus endophyticus]
MTATTPEDERRVAERYRRRRRPWLVPLLVACIGSLLGYWVWLAIGKANPNMEGFVSGFQVVSNSETRVKLMVDRRTPASTGECLVYVQSVDYERVGEAVVKIGPADRRTDERWVTVKTFRRGVSASVDHCR